jgi:hypothetical protein
MNVGAQIKNLRQQKFKYSKRLELYQPLFFVILRTYTIFDAVSQENIHLNFTSHYNGTSIHRSVQPD